MKAESRLAALERAVAGRPRPMVVLRRLIERWQVAELSDAELERVAGAFPDLGFLTDAALEAILSADGYEAVKALDALTDAQLRVLIDRPSDAVLECAIGAEQEKVRRLEDARKGL